MKFFEILNNASLEENLQFDESKYRQFMLYMELLKEWNNKINLTAITEDEEIIKKHFIDSLKVFKFTKLKDANRVIDIGTGAGFPGIPMKIMIPDIEVVLLDSLNKRVNFLNEVIEQLRLEKITAIHGRAEDFAQIPSYRESFDVAVSRAVANMSVLSELCIPYVKKNGYFVALKGPAVEEEIKDAEKAIDILGGTLQQTIEVDIDNTDLKHNLVVVKKVKDTPNAYPRKAGTAAKKPIK